jgi:hypothetical protein
MVYLVLAALAVAGVLLGLVWLLRRLKAQLLVREEGVLLQRAALERQIQARSLRNLGVWEPLLDDLPLVAQATSPLFHTPVYDCVGENFELPCQHSSYDRFGGQKHLGMPFGLMTRADVMQTLAEFGARPSGSIVFLRAGDCAYLIYSDTPREPGGMVLRFVRTGADAFMAYGWRAGARRNAGAKDPPFRIADLIRKPELWAERLASQQAAWRDDPNYRVTANGCPHSLMAAAPARGGAGADTSRLRFTDPGRTAGSPPGTGGRRTG